MIRPVGDPLQEQRARCAAVLPLHLAPPQVEGFLSEPARRLEPDLPEAVLTRFVILGEDNGLPRHQAIQKDIL
jgi:hypothetical protein